MEVGTVVVKAGERSLPVSLVKKALPNRWQDGGGFWILDFGFWILLAVKLKET